MNFTKFPTPVAAAQIFKVLAVVLQGPDCRLETLELAAASIGGAQFKLISPALIANTSLTLLRLQDNPLGNPGGVTLAEVLTRNTTLVRVPLGPMDPSQRPALFRGTAIGTIGASALVVAVASKDLGLAMLDANVNHARKNLGGFGSVKRQWGHGGSNTLSAANDVAKDNRIDPWAHFEDRSDFQDPSMAQCERCGCPVSLCSCPMCAACNELFHADDVDDDRGEDEQLCPDCQSAEDEEDAGICDGCRVALEMGEPTEHCLECGGLDGDADVSPPPAMRADGSGCRGDASPLFCATCGVWVTAENSWCFASRAVQAASNDDLLCDACSETASAL
jgi:hypothetical protein